MLIQQMKRSNVFIAFKIVYNVKILQFVNNAI